MPAAPDSEAPAALATLTPAAFAAARGQPAPGGVLRMPGKAVFRSLFHSKMSYWKLRWTGFWPCQISSSF